MNYPQVSNPVLADWVAGICNALTQNGALKSHVDMIAEAADRLRLWDVPVEQIEEVRRKQAEARRESAPLRRKRVHL